MVFGQGLSSGSFVIRPALPDYENYHNEYLTWLMDQGVVGLAAFVVFLYAVARRVMKSDHPLKNVMIGWLVFLSAAGFSSTISDQHLFWILLGTIVGASSWADNSGSSLQPVPRPVPQIPSSVVRGDEAFGGNKKPDWGRI
jgi:O-antigen ligase